MGVESGGSGEGGEVLYCWSVATAKAKHSFGKLMVAVWYALQSKRVV